MHNHANIRYPAAGLSATLVVTGLAAVNHTYLIDTVSRTHGIAMACGFQRSFLALVCFLGTLALGRQCFARVVGTPPTPRHVAMGLGAGILFSLAYDRSATLSEASTGVDLLTHLDTVLLGPIVEEWMFRGVLLTACRSVMPSSGAILLSALLFAFSHHVVESSDYAMLILFGALLGWLRCHTKCIDAPILAHSLGNALSW